MKCSTKHDASIQHITMQLQQHSRVACYPVWIGSHSKLETYFAHRAAMVLYPGRVMAWHSWSSPSGLTEAFSMETDSGQVGEMGHRSLQSSSTEKA